MERLRRCSSMNAKSPLREVCGWCVSAIGGRTARNVGFSAGSSSRSPAEVSVAGDTALAFRLLPVASVKRMPGASLVVIVCTQPCAGGHGKQAKQGYQDGKPFILCSKAHAGGSPSATISRRSVRASHIPSLSELGSA